MEAKNKNKITGKYNEVKARNHLSMTHLLHYWNCCEAAY